MLIAHGYGAKDIGNYRENQEDELYISKDGKVWAVADGMGGHEAGEVASRLAIEAVEWLEGNLKYCISDEEVIGLMDDAVDHAKNELDQYATRTRSGYGAGTTIVIMVYHLGKVFIAHLGDSRAHVFENGGIHTQLTKDHSFINEMRETGLYSEEELEDTIMKNVVTRCIIQGSDKDQTLEHHTPLLPKPGQIYLLHTDGLELDAEIADILFHEFQGIASKQSCQRLIQLALAKGSRDNVTVVLVQFIEQ